MKTSHFEANWLIMCCVTVLLMVTVGGITRLTNSGLSITEWKPVSGIVPPLDSNSWDIEFEKYKQSPEFTQNTIDMSIYDFKVIYMIEYIHRLLGRIAGLIFILPMIYMICKKLLSKEKIYKYTGICALFLLQGLIGWYMVKSGLVNDHGVSHFRLALHLAIAVLMYSLLFVELMNVKFDPWLLPITEDVRCVKKFSEVCVLLVVLQICIGAFVAGLKAGFIYNTFPLMGNSFIPSELSFHTLSSISSVLDSLSDPVFVQFMHRCFGYFVSIFIFRLLLIFYKKSNKHKVIYATFTVLSLQLITGIFNIIYSVPLFLGVVHQILSFGLLSCLLWIRFLSKSHLDFYEN